MNTKAIALTILAGMALGLKASAAEDSKPFKNDEEKVSYAIGISVGTAWKRQGVEVDYNQFIHGIKDATAGGTNVISDAEVSQVLTVERL